MRHRLPLPLVGLLALVVLLLPPALPTHAEDEAAAPAATGPSEAERARIKELVADLRQVTSEIRGLAWKHPVEADLLSREQMMAYMKAQVKEELDPEDLERVTRILHRLGMLRPDQDPLQMALDMITSMAGGFYNPKKKRLYLLAGQDPESLKPTIVHELLHALEDQYIDLQKHQDALEDDSDGLFAFKCMIEGSAETARMLFEARDPEAARMQMAGQSKNKTLIEGQKRTFQNTPAFMMLDTLLHYRTGPNFIQRALGSSPYQDAIDGIYADAPTTQEQVLHPERWLGGKRDLPQAIRWKAKLADTLGGDWTELYDMTQGELDLAMWLDFYLGTDAGKLSLSDMRAGTYVAAPARAAAEGWDGGRMVYVQGPQKQITVAGAFVFDTQEDANEAFDAFRTVLAAMYADGWTEGRLAQETGGDASLAYVGDFGPGRLATRGTALFWLDGLDSADLERAWPVLLATTFERAEGDTWDPASAKDPFADCEIAWRDTGVAWDLPAGWSANERAATAMRRGDPSFVGQVSRTVQGEAGEALGTVQVILRVGNQGLAKGVIPDVIKAQLSGPMGFSKERLREATVNGSPGYVYDLMPPTAPRTMRALVASTGLRTYIVLVRGPRPAVAAIEDEFPTLLDGIKLKHVY